MAKTWAQHFDEVLPYVPGCPRGMASQAVKNTWIDFLTRSYAWRYPGVEPLDVVASQQFYVFGTGATVGQIPTATKVVRVFDARYDGSRLAVATLDEFKALSETWDLDLGSPTHFTSFAENEIALWEIPEENGTDLLEVPEVALSPTQAATGVEDVLFEAYYLAVSLGARARLHAIPGKPYSDANEAQRCRLAYESALGSFQAKVAGGNHARIRARTHYR